MGNNDPMCRACGERSAQPQPANLKDLNDCADIYYNLTSITLSANEEPRWQMICTGCHSKLMEYDRFRALCLEVHCKLTQVKQENDEGQPVKQECEEVEVAFLVQESAFPSKKVYAKRKTRKSRLDDGQELVVMKISNYNEDEYDEDDEDDDDDDDDDNDDDDGDADEDDAGGEATTGARKTSQITRRRKKLVRSMNCHLCEKTFRSEARLDGHLRVHRGLKPALCKICGKDFMKWSNLKLHVAQKHSDENRISYVCDFPSCGQSYATKQGMLKHRKRHDPNYISPPPKRCVCELCGKTFSTKGALKKHNYIHTGEMPFDCTICSKKYPTAHKLKEHTMRHQGIKNHVCPHCGLKKTTMHELRVHINYHTKEKQFTCHMCAQIFTSIGNLGRHIKIVHHGVKAYRCTHCDRSFGKAETLKHHVMTHTGERPHKCDVCGKRFIQLVALQTHVKTHQKQQKRKFAARALPDVTPTIVPNEDKQRTDDRSLTSYHLSTVDG